jgi:hypothetical protein
MQIRIVCVSLLENLEVQGIKDFQWTFVFPSFILVGVDGSSQLCSGLA